MCAMKLLLFIQHIYKYEGNYILWCVYTKTFFRVKKDTLTKVRGYNITVIKINVCFKTHITMHHIYT